MQMNIYKIIIVIKMFIRIIKINWVIQNIKVLI